MLDNILYIALNNFSDTLMQDSGANQASFGGIEVKNTITEEARLVTSALQKIDTTASDAATIVVSEAKSVANVAFTTMGNIVSPLDFNNFADKYKADIMETREQILRISGISIDACTKLLPLLRLEIFRDFSQIISVVFASVYIDVSGAMRTASRWLGAIASSIAIDFGQAFRSPAAIQAGVIIALVCAVLTLLMFIWMVCCSGITALKMNAVRTGNEYVEFTEKAKSKTWTIFFVNATLLITMTLYLPLTQFAFQIVLCDRSSFLLNYLINADTDPRACVPGENGVYTGIQVFAYIVLLWFTLGLPFFLRKQILLHVPSGSPRDPEWTNDADGLRMKFDTRVYNELVEHDLQQVSNPFRSLYRGYAKQQCMWKVFVLIYKLVLTLVMTILSVQKVSNLAISIVSLGFMFFIFIYDYYASPFVEPMNAFMDTCGRFTTVIAALAGVINIACGANSKIASVCGYIVLITGVLNFFVMSSIMFSGVQWFRIFIKNTFGLFSFYDSCKNIGDLTAACAISTWQVEREVKHRVWRTFWDNIFVKYCGDDAARRLVQLQKQAIDYGIELISNHWACLDNPIIQENRDFIMNNLEGVDLYWDASREGRTINNISKFGKMYVKPYPFHCVIVYDDCSDEVFLETNDELLNFRKMQEDPSVKEKVRNRRILRALASQPLPVTNVFTRWESRHVPDGTESHTDSKGKSHTKTHYSTISIQMHYTKGYVQVKANSDLSYSAGFVATQVYHDGHGSAIKPRTGQVYTESNTPATMPLTHMGFLDLTSFSVDPIAWAKFLDCIKESGIDLQAHLSLLDQNDIVYRKNLMAKFEQDRLVLSNAFWFYVYNDATIVRHRLDHYFRTVETNPYLKKFADDHAQGLDYLYKRMELVDSDDETRLWFVFWEDFYVQNTNLKIVQKNANLFNPALESSICYKQLDRMTLEQWLRNIGMNAGCTKQYFDKNTLDILYDRLTHPDLYPIEEYKTKWQLKIDSCLGRDKLQKQLNDIQLLRPSQM